jgi:hypothetical protein
MQSLQGNHGSAAEGGNEGELIGQIRMALQLMLAIAGMEKLRYPTTVLYPQYWRQSHLSICDVCRENLAESSLLMPPVRHFAPEEEDMSLLLVVRVATLQP